MFYYWVKVDKPYQVRFIQVRLEEDCTRQNLKIDAYSMHVYESAASGMNYPYVWDYVYGRRNTPVIENLMYLLDYAGADPFEDICGPDVKPAEDVAEDEDDGLPTAGTAAVDLDRAHLPPNRRTRSILLGGTTSSGRTRRQ